MSEIDYLHYTKDEIQSCGKQNVDTPSENTPDKYRDYYINVSYHSDQNPPTGKNVKIELTLTTRYIPVRNDKFSLF